MKQSLSRYRWNMRSYFDLWTKWMRYFDVLWWTTDFVKMSFLTCIVFLKAHVGIKKNQNALRTMIKANKLINLWIKSVSNFNEVVSLFVQILLDWNLLVYSDRDGIPLRTTIYHKRKTLADKSLIKLRRCHVPREHFTVFKPLYLYNYTICLANSLSTFYWRSILSGRSWGYFKKTNTRSELERTPLKLHFHTANISYRFHWEICELIQNTVPDIDLIQIHFKKSIQNSWSVGKDKENIRT